MAEQTPGQTQLQTSEEASSQGTLLRLKDDGFRMWGSIPPGIRFLMILMLILAVSASVVLGVMDFTDMRVLYSDLQPQDSAEIAMKLKDRNIPYRMSPNGETIMVPAERVHELRLEMAADGLPSGGGIGYELFDEKRLGMTDFEERVSLTRALEGEIARTINRLVTVKNSRVHLVLAKRSLFGANATPSTGSVVLELHSGREISEEMMGAIVHLVSSAVEGLSPENVTVVDTRGRLLSSGGNTGISSRGGEIQQKYARDMEQRISEMLSSIVGMNRSVVKVTAEFDFQSEELSEEIYDPEGSVLRSEQRETEVTGSGTANAAGVPGTRSNLPGSEQPAGGRVGGGTKREKETMNYEVSRVVRRVVRPGAQLSRLSVAVLVDGVGAEGQPFEPRSPREMEQIEHAVKGAIGFNADRGDRVVVESVPFHVADLSSDTDVMSSPVAFRDYLPIGIGVAVFLFLSLLFLGFRKRRVHHETGLEQLSFPRPVGELETMMNGGMPTSLRPVTDGYSGNGPAMEGKNSHAALLGEVRELFLNDSEGASRVLKSWLREAASAQSSRNANSMENS